MGLRGSEHRMAAEAEQAVRGNRWVLPSAIGHKVAAADRNPSDRNLADHIGFVGHMRSINHKAIAAGRKVVAAGHRAVALDHKAADRISSIVHKHSAGRMRSVDRRVIAVGRMAAAADHRAVVLAS